MAQDIKFDLAVSENAIRIFQQNPGLTFSASDLQAISAGTLVAIPNPGVFDPDRPFKKLGCIAELRYDSDDDLIRVLFASGFFLDKGKAANLNDFRQTFQTAANFGFEVTACLYTDRKKLTMVNLKPCVCKCKCDGHD